MWNKRLSDELDGYFERIKKYGALALKGWETKRMKELLKIKNSRKKGETTNG